MAFCGSCGTKVEDGVKFCPSCGASVGVQEQQKQDTAQTDIKKKIAELNQTADTSSEYDAKDIADNKLMAILAYFGILWLIPYFARKESKYVQYHCKQAFTLFLVGIAYTVLSMVLRAIIKTPHYYYGVYYGSYTPGWVSTILWLISIPIFILSIIGIINVVNGRAKELPIIGKFKIMK